MNEANAKLYFHPAIKGSFSFAPDFSLRFNVSHYPNFFHRLMQRWCLGIYWRAEGPRE